MHQKGLQKKPFRRKKPCGVREVLSPTQESEKGGGQRIISSGTKGTVTGVVIRETQWPTSAGAGCYDHRERGLGNQKDGWIEKKE